jgi:hypothetical protein
LASHVVEEVFPGFASYKALGELFVETSEFVHERRNIVSAQVKFRDWVEVFVTSWTREHGLPPPFRVCCVVWQASDRIANEKSISRVVGIVELHHGRGKDELVNKWLKEFRTEALPFKLFTCNTAFYYTLVLAMFLFESFKQDVCGEVVASEAFPSTIRRKVIDFAAKIARSGHKTILKVTQAVWNELRISSLWAKSGTAPVFCSG